jgi:AcrR family transcriptional regulator
MTVSAATSGDAYLEERKAEILAAAKAVFIRHGFERATMQEIATEAGLSAGAIYRYFPGKESLVTAVCAAAGAEHLALFEVDPDGGNAYETLVAGGEAVWRALLQTPEGDDALRMYLEATLAALRHPDEIGERFAGEMAEEVNQLATLIAAAQREGSLASEVDTRALGALLLAVTQGMHVLHGQLDGDVDVDGAWELLTRMIAALRPSDAAS